MKNNHLNLIFLLITVIAFSSCNVEEENYSYRVNFKNTSDKPFYLLVLGDTLNHSIPNNDTLINSILDPGESSKYFSYSSRFFKGFKYELTYIKIKYLNENKGYICVKQDQLPNNLCFTTKNSPLYTIKEDFSSNDQRDFSYDITQEDYENAHVLL